MRKYLASRNSDDYEVISCDHSAIGMVGEVPDAFTPDLDEGSYSTKFRTSPLTIGFPDDRIPPGDAEKFKKAGFDKPAATMQRDGMFVARDCRVSALGGDDATVVNNDGHVYDSRASRVAKISPSVLVMKPQRSIPEAFILPFPHSSANYYHVVSEMIYGLRFADRIGPTVPIVYDADQFNLLPMMCAALKIDESRLVLREDVVDARIGTAYLPDSPSFYWNSEIYAFFRAACVPIGTGNGPPRKLYISRQKSKRSAIYEVPLQEKLQERGFDIVHAQDLTVAEQIRIFADATCVIAPHGAGLSNILYSKPGLKIIEIFDDNMISPDFYQRSKFITDDYTPVIAGAGVPDMWERIRPLLD
ncbi:glycosyltransferase family 61 protein [Falsirhodobacter algicola]|uniref:DUF563 domain-containing protein n=1 Tax=Falsirhodobacter algicola TaxID=2692330 RepID=A0A8J8MQM1_9RHOB|nr:glycosyltransferase 61 family protein [Falsirhodobacter algicola]QUS34895.1 DUF563 domain-containing protein [Falsirhodobacter algicola]